MNEPMNNRLGSALEWLRTTPYPLRPPVNAGIETDDFERAVDRVVLCEGPLAGIVDSLARGKTLTVEQRRFLDSSPNIVEPFTLLSCSANPAVALSAQKYVEYAKGVAAIIELAREAVG